MLASPGMAANIKGATMGEEGQIRPPPGRVCVFAGEDCLARSWCCHLEKDRAYGGTISIPNDADRKRRNLFIDTERAWFDLTDAERNSIWDDDGAVIYNYVTFKYDESCHRKYGDGLRCRNTWKRKTPAAKPAAGDSHTTGRQRLLEMLNAPDPLAECAVVDTSGCHPRKN
jgi:hypothetical protein